MPKLKVSGDKVSAPIFGESELILPEWFVMPMGKKGRYKLVNPTSQERNLSTRGGKKAMKLIRKPVKNAVLVEGMSDQIPIELFTKKDREIIKNHFKLVEQYKNRDAKLVPELKKGKPKERGRPETMKKNIDVNRARAAAPATEAAPIRGRPTKYATDAEKKLKKREQTLASNKRKRAEKKEAKDKEKAAETTQAAGGNIVMDIMKDGLGQTVKNKYHKTRMILTGNIDRLSPKNQQLLDAYGDIKINAITIKRTPVSGLLTGALSVFSLGKFGKRQKEKDFDELFHLFMEFHLDNGKRITVEKNERITLSLNAPPRDKTEQEGVGNFDRSSTLNEVLKRTKQEMGRKFYLYSSAHNNCQDFLIGILNANDMGTAEDRTFIKQDTKALFKDLPYLRKFSNTLTDIGARASVAMEGGNAMRDAEITAIKRSNKSHKLKANMVGRVYDKYITGGMIAPGTPPPGDILSQLQYGELLHLIRQPINAQNHTIFTNFFDGFVGNLENQFNTMLSIQFNPQQVNSLMDRFNNFRNWNGVNVVSPAGSDSDFGSDDDSMEGTGRLSAGAKKMKDLSYQFKNWKEISRLRREKLEKERLSRKNIIFGGDDDSMEGTGAGEWMRDAFFHTNTGRGLNEIMVDSDSDSDSDIEWDKVDWGSFTKQYERFKHTNKNSILNKRINSLEDFAKMILKHPEKYIQKTLKRARFYLNVLLPKSKNKMSGNSITMRNGEGLYASGDGIYAGEGLMAGQGCPTCGEGLCPTCGSSSGGAIHHHILDEIDGGNIFKSAGRWFKKAARTVNKAVIKPVAKEFTKKGKFQRDVDKAFSKGGIMEKVGKTAFREGVPILTGALAGAAGTLATGGLGGVAAGYAGSKGGEELVRMSGVGTKKGGARKGQPAGARLGYDDVSGTGRSRGQSDWIKLVKEVQRKEGISYKDAMVRASAIRKGH